MNAGIRSSACPPVIPAEFERNLRPGPDVMTGDRPADGGDQMRRPFNILAGTLFTLASLLTWVVLAPPPSFACSCALVSIADFNQPENQVFVGTAGALGPQGQPVAVELWLHGTGAGPLVWLARDSFGDGASCGTAPLPQGTRWILGTWLEASDAQPRIGLCNPHARIDSPEGQAMLGEALAAFGAGVAPPGRHSATRLRPARPGAPHRHRGARRRRGWRDRGVRAAAFLALGQEVLDPAPDPRRAQAQVGVVLVR